MDPVHDSAYDDDLAGRLYGLALEDLAAMLAYDKITATGQERGDIEAPARQMGMDFGSSWPDPAQAFTD
jgi:hypothetical protein